MFYYKKNIGDYYKKAGRLSMLEHGAYTLLIDACYDRERYPTFEDALDWTWARTDAEIEAVKFVLSKFFELKDGVYTQSRISDELMNYHALSETNSRIAKEREEKRRNRKRIEHEACTDGEQNVNEAPPNQEPRTKNQEPNIKESKFSFLDEILKLGGEKELVVDYIKHRKEKKASLLKTGFNGFKRELDKSGLDVNTVMKICIDKSWRGFESDWLSSVNISNYQDQKIESNTQEKIEMEWVEF